MLYVLYDVIYTMQCTMYTVHVYMHIVPFYNTNTLEFYNYNYSIYRF